MRGSHLCGCAGKTCSPHDAAVALASRTLSSLPAAVLARDA
jgi:hypothetical protein